MEKVQKMYFSDVKCSIAKKFYVTSLPRGINESSLKSIQILGISLLLFHIVEISYSVVQSHTLLLVG
jgi:hypothetical protein